MSARMIVSFTLLSLFCGCCEIDGVCIVEEVKIATDDKDTVFIVQLRNRTSKDVVYESCDVDFAFRYGLFKSASDAKVLDVEFLDSDIQCEICSDTCHIGPGESTNHAFGVGMHIKDVLPGDKICWEVDWTTRGVVDGVERISRIYGTGTCRVLTREEAIVEFCKVRALPNEFVEVLMQCYKNSQPSRDALYR